MTFMPDLPTVIYVIKYNPGPLYYVGQTRNWTERHEKHMKARALRGLANARYADARLVCDTPHPRDATLLEYCAYRHTADTHPTQIVTMGSLTRTHVLHTLAVDEITWYPGDWGPWILKYLHELEGPPPEP